MTTHYETVTHLVGAGIHSPDEVPSQAEFPTRTLFNEWVEDPDDANCPACLGVVSTVETDGPVMAQVFPATIAVAEWVEAVGRSKGKVFNPDTGGVVEEWDGETSEWMWVRLNNGDLLLGFYPRGEVYDAVEVPVDQDYEAALVDGTLRTIRTEE